MFICLSGSLVCLHPWINMVHISNIIRDIQDNKKQQDGSQKCSKHIRVVYKPTIFHLCDILQKLILANIKKKNSMSAAEF